MHFHRLIVPKRLLCLAVVFFFSALAAPAAVTNVVWYRLGESDAGAASGVIVSGSTTDLLGVRHLTPYSNPRYTNRFATAVASQVGSSLSVNFNGTSQYLSNAVVSTATNNFGLEVWVKPNATDAGNRTIVYNGHPLVSGWGLIQRAGTEYRASFGTMTAFGPGVAAAGVWAHLALVRDNGTATFYVNGVASGTSVGNPIVPATNFIVAAHPDFAANTWFNGAVDEIRVFTFAPGQFTTNDLLLNGPRVTTLPATTLGVANATLNGNAKGFGLPGSAWFEWGPTTNYGFVTAPKFFGAGPTTTNFSQSISGLVPHAYHFRAVTSNQLGVARGANVMFAMTNVASGRAGGGQPITLAQPSLELNYIICTNGYYASSGFSAYPPFYGEVRLFAGNFAPAGWMLCHGQSLSITDNVELFSLFGTSYYGGDGTNTFALPDTRSRVVVTVGQGPGLAPIVLGEQIGAMESALSVSAIPVHTHAIPSPNSLTGPAGSGGQRPNRQPYIGMSSVIYHVGNFPNESQTTYEPFMGEIAFFAGPFSFTGGFNNAPRTEGQLLPVAQNTALFSLLRNNFGGNGQTTFGLPDLRGRAATSIGQGPGLTARSLAELVGVENVTMTVAQMPSHQHTLPTVPPIVRLTSFVGSNPPQPQTLIQPSLAVKFLISTNGEVPSPFVQATNKMIGQIQLYAGTNLPGGWTLCDGQLLSVAAYPALFGVISYFYGGDGVTIFALPDLRGRIPVGAPTGQPGATYGTEQFVMTEAQLPVHTHAVPAMDFQSWCDFLGIVGTNASFEADPDGDGASNGYEWATGTGLTNATSFAPLTIAAIDKQARLRFSRNTNATDVALHLQRTVALGNSNAWAGLVTNVAGAWSLPVIVSETGSNSVKSVEVSDALTNNPAADYRLMITRP